VDEAVAHARRILARRRHGAPAISNQRSNALDGRAFGQVVGFRTGAASLVGYRRDVRAIRWSLRRLLHEPGFGAIVVLTAALGIGTATVVYSLLRTE
jgi:hypothetical protein